MLVFIRIGRHFTFYVWINGLSSLVDSIQMTLWIVGFMAYMRLIG